MDYNIRRNNRSIILTDLQYCPFEARQNKLGKRSDTASPASATILQAKRYYRRSNNLLFFSLLAILYLLLPRISEAYLGFTLSPARVDKALLGAELITEVFEVQNFSNDSLRIKIEFEDFDIDKEGKVNFMPPQTISNSVAPYTIVNPEVFFIPPQGIEYVRLTFRMPQDKKISEYYGMMLFKSQPVPSQYQPMITIAGEIGVPIYYSVANLVIKDGAFDSLFILNDSINIVFRNAGNIHLRVKGEVKVLKYDQTIIAKDSVPEFVVLPQHSRKIKLALKTILETGAYIIRVRFDYGAIQLMEAERRFVK